MKGRKRKMIQKERRKRRREGPGTIERKGRDESVKGKE